MENTLDSIYPSENPQQEMSYLFGRDPSILAYGQRPFPSKDTKKNLLSLYEAEENYISENASEHSESLQTVKVYVRLKPFPKKLKLTEEQQDAYKIINSTTLAVRLPVLDNNTSYIKHSKGNQMISRKFTFSQTFGPEATQLELFGQTVQQQMIDFISGHNSTIMTYGTTNSGKSYTLQGTTTSPGLIPRALEFLFSNITTKPSPFYKPLHYCDVVTLNALERAQELEAKTKLLTYSSVDKHQYINVYKEMQKLLQQESVRPSQSHDAHYSIWITFAEIYNEIIYDLLSNECQKKRKPLKLGTDSNGKAFIKGLKTVYVNSAAEAYQVLMAGQYNLKIAATALNAKSSRSHCIFTISLLKYYAENLPDTVEVSTFSFCDLAGSERLKKTLNIGDRLKEAQNINTSLLVLGRCLKSIHEGQMTKAKTDAFGPFRESKLTRLFQQALSGKEHLALIVNVNPIPNLYIETQNVLNFAAIAKRIVIEERKHAEKKLKSRFSQMVVQSIETVTDWNNTTEIKSEDWQWTINEETNTSKYVTSEEYMDLTSENENLKKEIAILKNSALIRDLQSRQEVAEKYISMINDLEIDWKQRINDVETQHEDALEWTVKKVEEFYKEKLNQLHRKKRRRTDYSDNTEEDDDCFNITFQEVEKENAQLRAKNETMTKKLMEIKVMNETLTIEKNKAFFELSLAKEDVKLTRNLLEAAQNDICFNENDKVFVKEMSSQLFAKDEQIKELKILLNEAKEEYISLTSDLRKKEFYSDEQAKIIIENEEKIEDLELQFEQINICLIEKTRIIELLQEKLEHQGEKLSDAENKILQIQEETDQLKNEKLALLKSYEEPICTTKNSQSKSEATSISILEASDSQNEYQEIIIKEELVIDDVPENLNIKHMQEKTNNAVIENLELKNLVQTEASANKTNVQADTNDLDSVDQTLSKRNSESLKILLTNVVCKPLRTLVEIACQTDDTSLDDIKNNPEKSMCYKDTQTTAMIIIEKQTQTSPNKTLLKEEGIQTSDIHVCNSELVLIKEENDTSNINVKQIDEHTEKMETYLEIITKLKDDIDQLNKNLETCQTEKNCIQNALDDNNKKLLELENRLEETVFKDQEKDTEISTLQKELKHIIHENENTKKTDDLMEAKLKNSINELTQTKETLSQKEQYIKELKIHLDNFERNAKIFNLLEENAKERQTENERLRNINDELRTSLAQKEREMDSFMRNRDETVMKYETLVKNNQEELDRQKREVMRYQELFRRQMTPTSKDDFKKLQDQVQDLQDKLSKHESNAKNKDDNDTISEDEVTTQQQTTKRRGKKTVLSVKQEDIPVIELSGSESKRSTRRTALTAPSVESSTEKKSTTRRKNLFAADASTEKKHTTRRKKLFVANESFADIEPFENVIPATPQPSTRNLRNRKK